MKKNFGYFFHLKVPLLGLSTVSHDPVFCFLFVFSLYCGLTTLVHDLRDGPRALLIRYVHALFRWLKSLFRLNFKTVSDCVE